MIETVCVASYHDYTSQGELAVLKEITPALLENDGEGILIDRRPDRHRQDRRHRARHDAEGAFRHRLRQAERPAAGRHLRHRVSQDTWIYFPWDMGFTYQKPIADDHRG